MNFSLRPLQIAVVTLALAHCFADDQQLLPPIELSSNQHRYGVELDLMGLSYHSNRSYDFNELNYGGGVSLTIGDDEPDDGYSAVRVASFGAYRDSYTENSIYLICGPRGTIGHRNNIHASVACQVGYVSGSGIHGAAIIPLLSFGYDRFDLCLTGDPFAKDAQDKSKFIACFLKIRVFDF